MPVLGFTKISSMYFALCSLGWRVQTWSRFEDQISTGKVMTMFQYQADGQSSRTQNMVICAHAVSAGDRCMTSYVDSSLFLSDQDENIDFFFDTAELTRFVLWSEISD